MCICFECCGTICHFYISGCQVTFGYTTNRSFSIWCDDAEHRGVLLAVRNLQTDFEKVTTVKPELSNIAGKEVRIIIGSFDKSPLIRQLVKTGKLDGKELRGKNEKYIITTLHAPLEGLRRCAADCWK